MIIVRKRRNYEKIFNADSHRYHRWLSYSSIRNLSEFSGDRDLLSPIKGGGLFLLRGDHELDQTRASIYLDPQSNYHDHCVLYYSLATRVCGLPPTCKRFHFLRVNGFRLLFSLYLLWVGIFRLRFYYNMLIIQTREEFTWLKQQRVLRLQKQ